MAILDTTDLPRDLHRRLTARAEAAGLSVRDFVLRELEHTLARPSRQEVLDRIAELPHLELDPSPAEILRQERDLR